MKVDFLWWGIGIGFWISIPVGPVGVLCIRRMLTESRPAGFASGVGAATADAVYAAVAAYGVTFISGFLTTHQALLRLLAALFLLYLGVRTYIARPRISADPPHVLGLLGDWASTFGLALSNVLIALELAAIFAAFNLTLVDGGAPSVGLLVAGVFLGSVLLWGSLTVTSAFLALRFSEQALRWINQVAGALIAGFGLLVLFSLILKRH